MDRFKNFNQNLQPNEKDNVILPSSPPRPGDYDNNDKDDDDDGRLSATILLQHPFIPLSPLLPTQLSFPTLREIERKIGKKRKRKVCQYSLKI